MTAPAPSLLEAVDALLPRDLGFSRGQTTITACYADVAAIWDAVDRAKTQLAEVREAWPPMGIGPRPGEPDRDSAAWLSWFCARVYSYAQMVPAGDARIALELSGDLAAKAQPAGDRGALPPSLAYLPNELHTQDNAGTADPIFLVEEQVRVYGVSSDYTDSFEEPEEGDGDRVGYVVRWRFVQACFTRKAAERYIESNRHNLTEPRIYVASGYRNREWIELRKWLASQPEQAQPSPAVVVPEDVRAAVKRYFGDPPDMHDYTFTVMRWASSLLASLRASEPKPACPLCDETPGTAPLCECNPRPDPEPGDEIENWRRGAVSQPQKPDGADADAGYPIGYWVSAGEIDEAVEIMRRLHERAKAHHRRALKQAELLGKTVVERDEARANGRRDFDALQEEVAKHGQTRKQRGEERDLREKAERMIGMVQAELAEQQQRACRFYNADGSYETLDSEEAVIERRKAAAKEIVELRQRADERPALRELEAWVEANSPNKGGVYAVDGLSAGVQIRRLLAKQEAPE